MSIGVGAFLLIEAFVYTVKIIKYFLIIKSIETEATVIEVALNELN